MSALSPERWQEISPHLDHALSLPERERAEWLSNFRAQHKDLAGLLEQLLQEHRRLSQERFLEHQPEHPADYNAREGETAGPYKLISRIGEGGMGNVWLAERADGRFERQVAVKFVHSAVSSRGTAERFQQEGKILGQLGHPHIAELVDAGVTAKGARYLVLEYVKGRQIDEYCDERRLDVAVRIELFLDVLRAVAHAHASLIVHRDIKPSNVLVTDKGEVKLLDFGIAKLLADDTNSAAATLFTLESGVAMTLLFAAPEQVTGGPITTATDVYALGVLLFLLLTGQHPAGAGPHSSADLVKSITEVDAPLASQAIALAKDAAWAEKRGATLEKIRRRLHGDLDTILSKALKKAPAERYSSVTALTDDLQRYLKHEPINARPDTIRYRAAKFVRRNRTAVALAGLASAAVIAGSAGTLIQARVARSQRDFALHQLARAEAINDLDEYVLSNAAPSGKPFTVNDLLVGAEHIVRRQQGDDTTRAEMLISIGRQYTVQDQYQTARSLLEEAYALSREVPEVTTRARAACGLGQVLSRTGDAKRADALFHEGFNQLPDDPLYVVERVTCLLRGSEIANNGGQQGEALVRAELAQRLLAQSSFRTDPLQLDALISLAGAYNHAGNRGKANQAFQKAASQLVLLGRDETQMAGTLFNNWGTMLLGAGRPRDAEIALRHTIEIGRDSTPDGSVSLATIGNYGVAIYELGRLDEAADYAEGAYEKAKKAGDDLSLSQDLFHRARIYRARGEVERAEEMLIEVEPLLRQKLPPDHVAFAILAMEQGLNAQARGDLSGAMKHADESLKMMEALASKGREPVDYEGKALVKRSGIALQLGRSDEARADASRALPLLEKTCLPGSYSADVGRAYLALGQALRAQGRSDEAAVAFRSAAAQLTDTLGPDHPDTQAARKLAGVGPQ